MTTLGLTGAGGFLGMHMRSSLLSFCDEVDVRLADRSTFADPARLDAFVGKCDAIVHVAGVNRGDDRDVEAGNTGLAHELVAAMRRSGRFPDVVYANSIQADRDTPYGRGKARAAEVLASETAAAGAGFVDVRLPNLFGEWGRPYYNSVVATFTHQLARGETPTVHEDRELLLMHAQDACVILARAARLSRSDVPPPEPVRVSVRELREVLSTQARTYLARGQMPALRTRLEVDLFNTLRFAALPGSVRHGIVTHADRRGIFFEALRHDCAGQVSVSTTMPGVVRGDHFHHRKVERFVVVSGRARIRIRQLFSTAVWEIGVDSGEPAAVDIPTLHPHALINVGTDELVTLIWSNDQFDPDTPDTISAPVDTVEAG
ncbi:MAG: NAD-dependent epimerase/dehydratase family protein [Acidimicrobiia bacterium]|nr:NAD-dependent epimerase/dehydratase family protein [Acidimicrobiia bacterium]